MKGLIGDYAFLDKEGSPLTTKWYWLKLCFWFNLSSQTRAMDWTSTQARALSLILALVLVLVLYLALDLSLAWACRLLLQAVSLLVGHLLLQVVHLTLGSCDHLLLSTLYDTHLLKNLLQNLVQ